MRETISRCVRILPAILLAVVSTFAEPQQNSSPELAVQIDTGEETEFEVLAFNGGGGGTSSFKLKKSWKPVVETPPVVELSVKINREGEVVVVHLSVKLANEKEVPVGTYRLRYNETTTAQELSNVGLEPVTLRVVKAKPEFVEPSPPIQPLLENRTKAVEVVNFYRESSAPNLFKLILRNISTKGIMAVDLFLPAAHGGYGQRAMGDRDHMVMTPGNTSEYLISVTKGGRIAPYGYVPDPPAQETLIIRTVVFDDGTYDGSVEAAAEIAAQRGGVNLQRKRILALLQQTAKAEDAKAQPTLEDFKEQVYGLNDTADASVVRDLAAGFPPIAEKSLEHGVKNGLSQGKRELLRYVSEFENDLKERRSNLTFAQWLTRMQADYQKRIERF